MKRILFALLFLLPLGCTAASSPSSGTDSSAATALADQLRAAGLTVEDAGVVEQPFFSVPARVFIVDGNDVQVYAFASASDAERAAAQVGPTGSTIGSSSMSWLAPPHFFRRDTLVVNYLGSSQKTVRELQRLLGPQFAGQ